MTAENTGHDATVCAAVNCRCRCLGCLRYHRYDGWDGFHLTDILIPISGITFLLAIVSVIVFGIIKIVGML